MKFNYKMSKQEWKDLLTYLRTAPNVYLTHYAETDNDGYFVDFCYATIEYKGQFYYLQDGSTDLTDFHVIRYLKLSPYEQQQNAFRKYVHSTEELFDYMNSCTKTHVLSDTHKQRIFLTSNLYVLHNGRTELQMLKEDLAGYREREILDNLAHITTVQHTRDYYVLRFYGKDGGYFEYETKSRRITG